MSKGYCEKSELTAIADAIRSKSGKTDTLTLAQMPTEIESLSTGGGEEYGTVTFNGKVSSPLTINSLIEKITFSSDFDTSSLTSMSKLFYGMSKITSLDLSMFDTSSVTDMQYIFSGMEKITSLDLSMFDTSSVTGDTYNGGLGFMFENCKSLTSIKFGDKWDTSKVVTMAGMFYNCQSLTSLDLSMFDTSSVVGSTYNGAFSQMFYGCGNLTSLNLSSFNTQNARNMYCTFDGCSSLRNLTLGTDWGINTSVKELDLSDSPSLSHDSCLDVFNKLADKTQTATTSATLYLHINTKALMSDEEIKIATDKGWTVS